MQPYFIGLGAQKSGTSWIYANLENNPQICMPIKEIHFFSRSKNFCRGIEWYEAHFRRCGQYQKCGEFCTSYLYSKSASLRIHQYYPQVKLLAVLRSPVDRAFSNFKNDVMAGSVKKGSDFSSALRVHPEYVDQGCYVEQIERYLKYFPREQLLVMIYEDIKKDPQIFMGNIYRFLEVNYDFVSPRLHERINPSYVPKSQSFEKILNRVSSRIQRVGGGGLARLLKKTGLHKALRGSNREKEPGIKELGQGERKSLHLKFENSIEKLEKLIGRELPEWRI